MKPAATGNRSRQKRAKAPIPASLIVVGIDASTRSTGLAAVNERLELIHVSIIKPLTRERGGEFARIIDIADQVAKRVVELKPNFIFAEDTFAGPNRVTNKVLARLAGAIAHAVAVATAGTIEVALLTPSEWRKQVGVLSKAEVGSRYQKMFRDAPAVGEDAQEAALIAAAGLFEISREISDVTSITTLHRRKASRKGVVPSRVG